MLQLIVVALLASGVVAEDAKAAKVELPLEAQPAQVAEQTVSNDADPAEMRYRRPMERMYDLEPPNDHLYLKAKLDGHHPEGPVIARNLHSSKHGPNIAAQDEIIRFTYSPAYYEPVWVLDYRFLKSGGRRYTRGPGGQILILPRSYRHQKGDGTYDYDSMIEHLRLKLIAEQNQRMREHTFGQHHDRGHEYEYEQQRLRQQEQELRGYERNPLRQRPEDHVEHDHAQQYGYEGNKEREYLNREIEYNRNPESLNRPERLYH